MISLTTIIVFFLVAALLTIITVAILVAVVHGQNVPALLLAFTKRTLAEIDPQAGKHVKSQLYDMAVRCRPAGGDATRLVFGGHSLASPPAPILLQGCLITEEIMVLAFCRRFGWHKSILIILREYCTPPAMPDLVVDATGIEARSDMYYWPAYCNPDGSAITDVELARRDAATWDFFNTQVRAFMRAHTLSQVMTQRAQALAGRRTQEIVSGQTWAGGDPRGVQQDETGQEIVKS